MWLITSATRLATGWRDVVHGQDAARAAGAPLLAADASAAAGPPAPKAQATAAITAGITFRPPALGVRHGLNMMILLAST
jgi:hypothetical protein